MQSPEKTVFGDILLPLEDATELLTQTHNDYTTAAEVAAARKQTLLDAAGKFVISIANSLDNREADTPLVMTFSARTSFRLDENGERRSYYDLHDRPMTRTLPFEDYAIDDLYFGFDHANLIISRVVLAGTEAMRREDVRMIVDPTNVCFTEPDANHTTRDNRYPA